MPEQNNKKMIGKRSAEDAQQTRQTLIEVATQIFAEKGFENASLREIASAAGVTHGTLRHHFGSKDDIWQMVADEIFRFYREGLLPQIVSANNDGNHLAAFKTLVTNFIQITVQRPEYTRLIVQETRTDNPRAAYYFAEVKTMHAQIEHLFLKARADSPALSFHTNDSFLYALMSLTTYHILHPQLGVDMHFPLNEEVPSIEALVMRMLFRD